MSIAAPQAEPGTRTRDDEGSEMPNAWSVAVIAGAAIVLGLGGGGAREGIRTQVAGADAPLWIKLRSEPNLVVFMRHSHSTGGNPLTWDETGNCRGESVLSAKGKDYARKIGDAFMQHAVKPSRFITSPMCRCRETAQTAFGDQFATDPELREIASADRRRTEAFEETALALIARHRGAHPIVFISHRPNIYLLTMELIDTGDLLVARVNDGGEIDILGKIRIEP